MVNLCLFVLTPPHPNPNPIQAQPLHTAAYFFGKDIAFLHQSLVGPMLYNLVFTALTAPRASFFQLYAPLVAVYYAAGGIGYIVSVVVAPEVSQLVGVITVFSFAMFSGGLPVLIQLKTRLPPFCYVEYVTLRLVAAAVVVVVKMPNTECQMPNTKCTNAQMHKCTNAQMHK